MTLLASTADATPVAWPVRVTAMVLGSLAVVATEALWRVRPWVWPTTAALAVAHTAAALAWTVGMNGGDGLAFLYLFYTSVVVVPIVVNVYQKSVNPHFPNRRRPARAP